MWRRWGSGSTLVAYLRGVGAGAVGTVEVTTTEATSGMAGALWLAVAAVVAAVAATTGAVRSRLGLEPSAGGGEKWRTRGLKLCPLRVFTMPGQERGGDRESGRRRI